METDSGAHALPVVGPGGEPGAASGAGRGDGPARSGEPGGSGASGTPGASDAARPADAAGAAADAAAVRRFVERFAMLLTESGWPRMAARVFACLLADERGRLTAGELASRLGVSPAAVSGAVRYLVQLGLITRDRDPGARSDHYHVEHGMWQETWMQQSGRLHRWVDSLTEGIDVVGADSAAGRRLDETRAFFAFLEDEMDGLMQRWRERSGTA